jgi:hypothetical protein
MSALGRRYAEVLLESLGQPGFRELIVVATDLDSRRDLIGALVSEPYAQPFWPRVPIATGAPRCSTVAGPGRDRAIDLVAAALTPPVAFDPWLVTFARRQPLARRDAPVDRSPGAVHRLLEEGGRRGRDAGDRGERVRAEERSAPAARAGSTRGSGWASSSSPPKRRRFAMRWRWRGCASTRVHHPAVAQRARAVRFRRRLRSGVRAPAGPRRTRSSAATTTPAASSSGRVVGASGDHAGAGARRARWIKGASLMRLAAEAGPSQFCYWP